MTPGTPRFRGRSRSRFRFELPFGFRPAGLMNAMAAPRTLARARAGSPFFVEHHLTVLQAVLEPSSGH
jgi:hypothetical protein